MCMLVKFLNKINIAVCQKVHQLKMCFLLSYSAIEMATKHEPYKFRTILLETLMPIMRKLRTPIKMLKAQSTELSVAAERQIISCSVLCGWKHIADLCLPRNTVINTSAITKTNVNLNFINFLRGFLIHYRVLF